MKFLLTQQDRIGWIAKVWSDEPFLDKQQDRERREESKKKTRVLLEGCNLDELELHANLVMLHARAHACVCVCVCVRACV
jgi:hypothetical protein